MFFDQLLSWFPQAGTLTWQSAMVLGLIFFFASFVLIPRTFLCLAAGASAGLSSVFIIMPTTIAGGICAFLLARRFLNTRLRRYVSDRPRLSMIADAVDAEGWRLVALLRFASPVPNAIQNYLFGLTRIPLSVYAATSFVFSVPQIVLYVYLGAAGRQVLFDDSLSTINRILFGLGLLTLATAACLVFRHVGSRRPAGINARKSAPAPTSTL